MKEFLVLVAICALVSGANIRPHRRAPRLDGRIVGGNDTDIKDVPYQLYLVVPNEPFCGASIISENWAITAAQCVLWNAPSEISIRAGSSIRGEGGSIHQVVEKIIHPEFNILNFDFDYALVRVETPFPIGQPGVQAIPLADEEPSAGTSCIVSGWGTLSFGGPIPKHLQSVKLPIIEREECDDQLSDPESDLLTDSMLCAGVPEGGVDACQGDQGGPLVCDGVLVGIASWGYACAEPESPGVYANVADQREWIREESGV